MSAFTDPAFELRWLAWRNQKRGDKWTKVPFSPARGPGSATDPTTWGTRTAAEARAHKLVNGGGDGGGVGAVLGDLGNGFYAIGLDLDTCLAADGTLAPWAAKIVQLLATYTEISPSGKGLKLFCFLAAEAVRPFLTDIGVGPAEWGTRRGIPGEDGKDHGPAVELYCSHRYFTVTEKQWPGAPNTITYLDPEILEELIKLIPPAKDQKNGAAGDDSRSAKAFRKGAPLRRTGKSFEEMVAALRTDPETADWVREKGDAAGGRELRRIWDKAEPDEAGRTSWTLPEPDYVRERLSLDFWPERELPPLDPVLGELVTTTSRILVVGPTGLGKTNFLMAAGFAMAAGADFLHWRGDGRPRRVLYVDGEMSRRLLKQRLADAERRFGQRPTTFFAFSREDFPDMPPLDSERGQQFIDGIIEALGGVDIVILDNLQALTVGDLREPESFRKVLPWVLSLTMRNIGQIWVHHTGLNEDHGYGDKSREWQLDTVMLMVPVEVPAADIDFTIKFTKARERTSDNRADFDPAQITLANDTWNSNRTPAARYKRKHKDRALELLEDEIARHGEIPPANSNIPAFTACVPEGLWRRRCGDGFLSEGNDEAKSKAIQRARKALLDGKLIGFHKPWVWIIRKESTNAERQNS